MEMPLVGSSSRSNARRADHRHGDVEQLAHALRQRRRQRVAIAGDLEQLDGRIGLGDGRGRFQRRQHAARTRRSIAAAAAAAHMFSNTVSDGKICATWNEREMPSRVISREGRPVMSMLLEADRALRRPQMAGDHVDERGLAGAVGADDADGLLRRHVERDVARGDDRAEGLFQIAHGEDRGSWRLLRHAAQAREQRAQVPPAGTGWSAAAPSRG